MSASANRAAQSQWSETSTHSSCFALPGAARHLWAAGEGAVKQRKHPELESKGRNLEDREGNGRGVEFSSLVCRAPVKTPFHQSTTVSRY
eukprot:scaffold29823_cov129-Isochrysis_galbana.AAC.6